MTGSTAPSSGGKAAVLFRTHYWNEFIDTQFNRLCAMAGDGVDIFVTYDETNGPARGLPAAAAQRLVGHSLPGFASLGLDIQVARGMWHLGDYPFYDFIVKWPGYAQLAMIENDVFLGPTDFSAKFAELTATRAEFSAFRFGERKLGNDMRPGTRSAVDYYPRVWNAFFPLVFLSGDFAAHLFERRKWLGEQRRERKLSHFPHCEAFVATEAAVTRRRWVPLRKLFRTSRFQNRPFILHEGLEDVLPDEIIHPVVPAAAYVRNLLREEILYNRAGPFAASSVIWPALERAVSIGALTMADLHSAADQYLAQPPSPDWAAFVRDGIAGIRAARPAAGL